MSPAGLKVSAVLRSTDITADARGFGHEVFGKFLIEGSSILKKAHKLASPPPSSMFFTQNSNVQFLLVSSSVII